ncbi:aminopeptidase A, a cyteinylglycinase [Candidatus Terasakiella magnetica]|nr:aminopeptidase A, a cyteinylglycinase [Candidatus Terasakiella magnetica]
MKIAFSKPSVPAEGAIAVGVLEGKVLLPTALSLDVAAKGGLARAIAASRFEGKKGQTLMLLAPAGLTLSRVLLVGLGKAKEIDVQGAQTFGGTVVAQLQSSGEAEVAIAVDAIEGSPLATSEFAVQAAFGARLRSYRFDKYMTKQKKEDKPSLKRINLLAEAFATAKTAFAAVDKVADGVLFTRDMVSEPANVIHPESLAELAQSLGDLGVEVEVLGEKQMKKLGMGALLGVGQGSDRESKLVVMRWQGAAKKDEAPIAFIGKGVTFDSGGISIKPAGGMEDMKWDMAGAGAVLGVLKALAGRKAKVNAIGVVGLVENMPSGTAQRPGDVVTSMSGQTIEVINTDAEGRLVLADALWYTQDRFKPKAMIDLATLTGAIIISLGHEYAGLFASDDKLADRLAAAGKAVGEQLWRLPLGEAYDKQIKSDIADMKNTGGREGGSITAAQFLKRFTNDVTWAHLDIAGMAWSKKDTATCPKGATAFGVRLLDRLVTDYYEDKGEK